MLRLKIGKNYLLMKYTAENSELYSNAIPYMMGCFKGTNCLAMALHEDSFNKKEIIASVEELRAKVLYILQYIPILQYKRNNDPLLMQRVLETKRAILGNQISTLKTAKPDLEIKVINVNAYENTPAFRVARALMRQLTTDKNSILSSLPVLETYKYMSKRYATIPGEIKIIDNDLKKLSKKAVICDRVDTVESLKYLKLIKSATKSNGNLKCHLHKLPIYPSEPLGAVFEPVYFRNNPYLFKAASYIYQGYHFGMPETIIEIDTGFRLHFCETVDKTFNNMFRKHNWSGVGYPHFGDHGFCPGEFNDTMAHAKEYGLGYYFTSLKQYLTTANMRDLAGVKVFWYPIYDDAGNMVYCAGLDILINECIKRERPAEYEQIKDLSWEEKAKALSNVSYDRSGILNYGAGNLNYRYHGEDAFLMVCKEKDEELYNKIMEGMKH